ncbi:MAG: hypothetical protein P8P35_03185 [Planktotalea sp.]|uniref:hypothetical protein n=1 Tax=Planktotalea sp. TaxID=2029877 RepID=UPI0026302DA5|nr:hypothetical protein [Planktotalea sp.]MDG1083104.1 hypothetical protein [Planktotalea sp.]
MTQTSTAMRWGAYFTALSAGLHLLALPLSRFSADALILLPFALVYAGFAYGLFRGWRWLAYVVFIVLLVGISLAIARIWANGDVPRWIYMGIAGANILSVTTLFVALWKQPDVIA